MPQVTVDATWRMNRVEFALPHDAQHFATGHGEVLLKGPPTGGAAMLKRRPLFATPQEEDGESITYGAMPADPVGRMLTPEVLAETIKIAGNDVTLAEMLVGLAAFFEKWRVEDTVTPPYVPPPLPQGEAVTPVPPPPLIPEPLPPQDATPP